MRRAFLIVVLAWLGSLPCLTGCGKEVTCKSEVTGGDGTFNGLAKGKEENKALRTESVKDACRQLCAAKKEMNVDACAARCAADAEAGKVGAKTSCSRF